MPLPVVGTLLEAGLRIIDKVIPDPAQKAQAQLDLMRLQQEGQFKELETDLQLAMGQVEINKIEAGAPDLFRGGWRPAAGWLCVVGLAASFVGQPLLAWISEINAWPVPPKIETGDLLLLLLSLLGLGTQRMLEKFKGVA